MRTWQDSSPEQAGPWALVKGEVFSTRLLECPHPLGNFQGCVCPLPPPSSGGPSACSSRGLYTFSDFLLTSAQQRQLGDSGPRCRAPSSVGSLFAQAFGAGPLA